jgi:hypothetical protein
VIGSFKLVKTNAVQLKEPITCIVTEVSKHWTAFVFTSLKEPITCIVTEVSKHWTAFVFTSLKEPITCIVSVW